jgi:hypothetical protein
MRTFILIILLMFLAAPLSAGTGRIPEKLTYSLSWTGIPVGTASQSITDDGNSLQIKTEFKSNAWLSSFYPVDNQIETTLARKPGYFPGEVRQFRMRFCEGSRVRNRSITFDHVTGKAHYKDHLTNEMATAAIRPDTGDVMTAFYNARHLPVTSGATITLPVMDGPEPYLLEVKVLEIEKLRTILGKVETLVVQPMVRPEGTFEGKRGVKLWITNDARRIPVKIRTMVTVGSVTATLTGIE